MSPSPASSFISTVPERNRINAISPNDKSNPTSPYRHIRNRHAPLTSIREVADDLLQCNRPSAALPSAREVADSSRTLRTRTPIADVDALDHTAPPIREDAALTRFKRIREVADTESARSKKFPTPSFLSSLLRSLRGRISATTNRRTGSTCGV